MTLRSRALDLQIVLPAGASEVVSTEELTARVYRDTVVDDSALRVQAVSARKA